MPTYRTKMGYGQNNIGWSETWWLTGEAPGVANVINQMMIYRAEMLWDTDYWVGVSVAQEGSRRKSQFFPAGTRYWTAAGKNLIIPTRGTQTGTSAAKRQDQVRAALQLRLQFNGGYSTLRYLCPVADGLTTTEGVPDDLQGNPAWVEAFNQWREFMVTSGAQIKGLIPAPDNPERTIRNMYLQEAAPGLIGVGVLTADALDLTTSARVHIRGQKKKPSNPDQRTMNGVWVVDSVNTTQVSGQVIYYLRNTEGIDPTSFRFLGTVQVEKKTFYDVESLTVHRAGIHKRGRPFGSPRGRRLTRRTLDP